MDALKISPLLQRQRVLLGILLLAMVGLAWTYLIWMASHMALSDDGRQIAIRALMPAMTNSYTSHIWWLFVMWSVMSVAMMLPTALPMVMLFSQFWSGRHPSIDSVKPTLLLVLGYLSVWIVFGFAAALIQLWLEYLQAVTPVMGRMSNPIVGGLVLMGAGLFQLTPLKTACLSKCRTPMMFLNTRWREGRSGPFLMGLDHGAFCLGCCWALMLVMFVAGVMNLLWMAALAALMLAEKIVPKGDKLVQVIGWGLMVCGVVLILI
jgi:predicted metal-binding membrane protein